MKIGIISDTHNKVEYTKETIEFLKSQDIEYLLHAGDIGKDVLNFLIEQNLNFIAVLGNTDTNIPIYQYTNIPIYKEPHYFKLFNTTFKLMHHPYFLTPDVDVIIYGHLHKFGCEKKKSLYINPGEVCAREKPKSECAILEIADRDFTLYYCFKELEKENWKSIKKC